MFDQFTLSPLLVKACVKNGWTEPTPVQGAVIPVACKNVDVIVSAETGSGKSGAFLLPMLDTLLKNDDKNTATLALILAPTRELVNQIGGDCKALASFTRIKSLTITGGESLKEQAAKIRKNPEIIIATPGRLIEHIVRKSIVLSDLKILVLDEADRMLDMGFRDDVTNIIALCPDSRQTMLFSATLKHQSLANLTSSLLSGAQIIDLSTKDDQAQIVQQIILADDVKHKQRLLDWLLRNESYEKVIIFCNTRSQADQLGNVLRYHQHKVDVLHGEKQQDRRKRTINAFNEGLRILVATDVAARGLDVPGIDMVINFDMARKGDEHVHRVGRTGRAGNAGLSISFVTENEWNLMASIERYLKIKFQMRRIKPLMGTFSGPKKLKSSGKSVGTKGKKSKHRPAAKK